jgi:hypothetical protein
MRETILLLSNTPSWRGAQLKKKQRDSFALLYVFLEGRFMAGRKWH